jgi:hypothetical protein
MLVKLLSFRRRLSVLRFGKISSSDFVPLIQGQQGGGRLFSSILLILRMMPIMTNLSG